MKLIDFEDFYLICKIYKICKLFYSCSKSFLSVMLAIRNFFTNIGGIGSECLDSSVCVGYNSCLNFCKYLYV